MLIENKIDYSKEHKGYLWAKELNTIVKELLAIFLPWFSPELNDETQVVNGINLLGLSNLWSANPFVDGFAFSRRVGLPVPIPISQLTGYVRFNETNITPNPKARFLNGDWLPMFIKDIEIGVGTIMPNELYMWVMESNTGTDVVSHINLYPVTVTSDNVQELNRGKTITTEPILISDNSLVLPTKPNGDLIFGRCEVYSKTNDLFETGYDTFMATIDPLDPYRVLINPRDGIELDGKYGVVSYTT